MKVHVTGGSGFLGGHVVPLLLARGHDVTALARSDRARHRVTALGATPVMGDLEDPASTDAAFAASGAEALVNIASLGFGHAPTIVSAGEEAGMKRALFVSTTSVFTRLEARSKAVRVAAEETVRRSALDWTILRPTMIYGTPEDRNMARLLRLVRRVPVVPLPGGGRGLQQPVHVDDLAEAVVTALERPVAVGREYEVAGPDALTLRQLVGEAAAAVGRRPVLVTVPLAPVAAAASLTEKALGRSWLRAEQIERLAEDKCFDIGPARDDLGFEPRSFSQGIAQEAALLA